MAYNDIARGKLGSLREEVLIRQFADASKLLIFARWMSWPDPPKTGDELKALQTAIYDLKHRADLLDRRLNRGYVDEFTLARELREIRAEKERRDVWLKEMKEKV